MIRDQTLNGIKEKRKVHILREDKKLGKSVRIINLMGREGYELKKRTHNNVKNKVGGKVSL